MTGQPYRLKICYLCNFKLHVKLCGKLIAQKSVLVVKEYPNRIPVTSGVLGVNIMSVATNCLCSICVLTPNPLLPARQRCHKKMASLQASWGWQGSEVTLKMVTATCHKCFIWAEWSCFNIKFNSHLLLFSEWVAVSSTSPSIILGSMILFCFFLIHRFYSPAWWVPRWLWRGKDVSNVFIFCNKCGERRD